MARTLASELVPLAATATPTVTVVFDVAAEPPLPDAPRHDRLQTAHYKPEAFQEKTLRLPLSREQQGGRRL